MRIDHVGLDVSDYGRSKAFYELIAPHAGLRLGTNTADRVSFAGSSGTFSLVRGAPTSHLHMAFPGEDSDVDSFHAAALDAGYRDNGAPGERPRYHPGYYSAYVLDPDGNNIEVVNHHRA